MELDRELCFRAVRSRDVRFDGRLFIAVITTGIYCRPICPAPAPHNRNVTFFADAAAAEHAGFRPCLRCRPEVAPWTPAWEGTSTTVSRAMRLIGEGALDGGSVDTLATRLGVTARQVRRLFLQHLGVPPIAIAQSRRVHFARTLLLDTSLPIADVAVAAGFSSARRFNTAIQQTYRMSPRSMRRGRAIAAADDELVVSLPFRAPFDWDGLLGFLTPRLLLGVEAIRGQEYRRSIRHQGVSGIIRVWPDTRRTALLLAVPRTFTQSLKPIVDRVRRQFDLFADPAALASHLMQDPTLAPLVERWPGMRVPGAWDPFELAIRAIVGQQVSVAAATTHMSRIASLHGDPLSAGDPDIRFVFPDAERLAGARVSGMTTSRLATIRAFSEAVASGAVRLESHQTLDESVTALTRVRGIGPWTANYVAMRGFGEPDAFPQGDLVLRRALGCMNDRELLARAERWRPWRAYAAMMIWRSS